MADEQRISLSEYRRKLNVVQDFCDRLETEAQRNVTGYPN
jgi:hypothetical protein